MSFDPIEAGDMIVRGDDYMKAQELFSKAKFLANTQDACVSEAYGGGEVLKSPVGLGHVAEKIGRTAESTEAIHEGGSVLLKCSSEPGVLCPAFA